MRRVISTGIKNEVFSFDHEHGDSFAKRAKAFRSAFDKAALEGDEDQVLRMLGHVDYALVETITVNENPFL